MKKSPRRRPLNERAGDVGKGVQQGKKETFSLKIFFRQFCCFLFASRDRFSSAFKGCGGGGVKSSRALKEKIVEKCPSFSFHPQLRYRPTVRSTVLIPADLSKRKNGTKHNKNSNTAKIGQCNNEAKPKIKQIKQKYYETKMKD